MPNVIKNTGAKRRNPVAKHAHRKVKEVKIYFLVQTVRWCGKFGIPYGAEPTLSAASLSRLSESCVVVAQ